MSLNQPAGDVSGDTPGDAPLELATVEVTVAVPLAAGTRERRGASGEGRGKGKGKGRNEPAGPQARAATATPSDRAARQPRARQGQGRQVRGLLADPTLSLAAKGLVVLLLTRPPGAVVSRAALYAACGDAMARIDQAISELVAAGLAKTVPPSKRGQVRASGGVSLLVPIAQPQPEPALAGGDGCFGRREPEWSWASWSWSS
jgi:hypothetical protein